MMQRPSRPIGITILAVLEILIGVVGLLVSIAIIGLSALFATLPVIGALLGSIGLIIGGISLLFSLIWLATGVGFLHGKGWSWTLGMIFSILCIIGAVYAITIGLVTSGILGGIIFWGLMLYYLTRKHVKIFFGKSGPSINPAYQIPYSSQPQLSQPQIQGNILSYGQPSPTVPSLSQTQQPGSSTMPTLQTVNPSNPGGPNVQAGPKAIVSCPYCGSKLTTGSPKCMTCGATI